jgi:hypothetical protein
MEIQRELYEDVGCGKYLMAYKASALTRPYITKLKQFSTGTSITGLDFARDLTPKLYR